MLLVDEPDGRETVVELAPERVDDAAVEEDAVRQRIDEQQPDPALPAGSLLPDGVRPVVTRTLMSDADARRRLAQDVLDAAGARA